ncbi:MAG TPA: IclR family transcriptional regulator [Pseudacidobacterium sp.]|jgi:DNA-binding IclR family transcriptional regulator|nr:IclR family transcriptional regulator [Pseudacidobacterium sp.]
MNAVVITPSETGVNKHADPYQLQSIDRIVAMLDMLSESDVPLSLAEICTRMGLHKSTAHRSLIVLERSSMIERTPEGRFRLGLKLYELGNRAVEQIDLRERVQPFFRRLATEVGETVHLSVLQKTRIVYLDKVEPNRRICMTSKTGTSNPVYCTSMGKAMLAFLPEEAREEVLSKIKYTRYTSKTLCSREALLKSLERVKKRGFAIDDEEIEVGVRCVGAPIFDENRYPIAAVSVSGPASRITVQSVPGIAERLIRCSNEISRTLGIHDKRRSRYVSPFFHHYSN